ncbi:unnamed protein product [Sphagnum troendelagicum]|uniref:Aluminum-activated malate transporter n=1 Tax=Sphagnum troendelagicum TaxID=128251 RepID=A0ABP0U920_9BRYO
MEEDGPVKLSRPFLNYSTTSSYEDQLLGSSRTGNHGVLAAASSRGGLSYARARSLLRKRDLQRTEEAAASLLWKAFMWPVTKVRELEKFKTPVTLPLKAGLAALVAGLLCFAPGFLRPLNKNGVWAVITVDIVLEMNVGLTFSKGLNRTMGTSLAAALALVVDFIGSFLGKNENYFLLICTFLGGALPTIFKFRRPFKDRWNYAVVMSMITFHLLILNQSDRHSKFRLPMIRIATIAIGFLIATFINVLLLPNFAGNNVNNLLATNFERAGNVVERCVGEYCKGTVLDELPEVLTDVATDDLHSCFHEIVAADSELEKLLNAAKFEPPHGKFFFRYPWHIYDDVSENLRYAFYDVVALDACLRAEIQAPLNLRGIFRMEFLALGKECAEVFRTLGKMMRNMERVDSQHILERAEEMAILLQHNIAKYSDILLQGAPFPVPTQSVSNDHTGQFLEGVFGNTNAAPSETSDNSSHAWSSHPEYLSDMHSAELQHEQREEREQKEKTIKKKAPKLEGQPGEFLKRKGSIGDHWDVTVQRLAALSLLKFASLLIEIAAKAKYVVSVVDELAVKAHFDNSDQGISKSSPEFDEVFSRI